MIKARHSPALRKAARACGIATSYRDYKNDLVVIKDDVLESFLAKLSPAANPVSIVDRSRQDKIKAGPPAAVVCWDGFFPVTWIWLEKMPKSLILKFSGEKDFSANIDTATVDNLQRRIKGKTVWRVKLAAGLNLPFGYYDLEVSTDTGQSFKSFAISAPRKVKSPDRAWGVFAPTYALRSAENQGLGGYAELKKAARYVHEKGGAFLGTLPLLPPAHEKNAHSPYSPLSRFFWDEIYLDVAHLPGVPSRPVSEFDAYNSDHYINYREIFARKKEIISDAARHFFSKNPDGDEDYKTYVDSVPFLKNYADFRAQSYDDKEAGRKYHLYAQYACHVQLTEIKEEIAAGKAAKLYFDYPVGVDPQGFDCLFMPDLFLPDFRIGAPSDLLAPAGQNWGLLPLNPHEMIRTRFKYFRDSLRHYFHFSHILRLDHVMGLYRIFCVPEGKDGSQGTYIYYPFETILAVLCLEAHKYDAILIGENLGTVPDAVNKAMHDHNIFRMWILQFEMKKKIAESAETIEPDMVAGLNTHDLFPFESFLKNKDIAELKRHGLIDSEKARELVEERKALLSEWKKESDPLQTGLKLLAESSATFVIVGMEDLWKENLPQNVPGTMSDYNWSRKFAFNIEDWEKQENVINSFEILNKYRKRAV